MAQEHTIDQLGGAAVVGQALRSRGVLVADVTVRSWTLSGRKIPAKYWTHIVAISAGTAHSISFEELALAVEYRAPAPEKVAA